MCAENLEEEGIVIVERKKSGKDVGIAGMILVEKRSYGNTEIVFFRRRDAVGKGESDAHSN